jgi:hypothetical protein
LYLQVVCSSRAVQLWQGCSRLHFNLAPSEFFLEGQVIWSRRTFWRGRDHMKVGRGDVGLCKIALRPQWLA